MNRFQEPRAPNIASVGFLLIPGFPLMTYACAVEPLRAANRLAGRELYRWWHVARSKDPVIASNGTAVLPDFPFGSAAAIHPDLLIVCAGGNPATFKDRKTFAWLRSLARRGVIMGGISGGPFVLANAGLLDGRRCTVHWEHVPAMQEAFPNIRLTQSLFEIDTDRITCSGGVAALDMMVKLITRDHGHELGAAVSDWFLHTNAREGGGAQRMDLRSRLGVTHEKLLKVLKVMELQIEVPHSRERLAKIAGVSIRQLERLFRVHLRSSLHQYYLALRLGRAKQLLHETSLSILEISVATGFQSASQFSRAFKRSYGISPRRTRLRN